MDDELVNFRLYPLIGHNCPICHEKVMGDDYILCDACMHKVKNSRLYTMDEAVIRHELSRISTLANSADDEALSKELSLYYYKLLESTSKDKDDFAVLLSTVILYVLEDIQGDIDQYDDNFACIVDYYSDLFNHRPADALYRKAMLISNGLEDKVIQILDTLSIRDMISLVTLTCACVSLAYEYDLNYESYDLLVRKLKENF